MLRATMDVGCLQTHWREFGTTSHASSDASWRGLDAAALASRLEADDAVPENDAFRYQVVAPVEAPGPSGEAIVLLHGLNERRWARYLPWAEALARRLRRPVVLFPIAFHMQRSPDIWCDSRCMHGVSNLRKHRHVVASSFANAALSTRLQARPERFYWSGLQTIADLTRLGEGIRRSNEPLLRPDARLDLFAYSIGAFLSVILLSSARQGPWADARLFAFCGGCTLADCDPVSKEILDQAGSLALRECFDHGLEHTRAEHPELARSLDDDRVGQSFHAMLHPLRCREERGIRLEPLSQRLCGVGLVADRVMSATAIERTFAETHARFEVLDFAFPYGHTAPFGSHLDAPESVRAFEAVFDRAAEWLH